MLQIPENVKPVRCLAPVALSAERTGDYVSLKNVNRLWIIASLAQGNATACALTPKQATAVAGTSAKALTNAVPIWANEACATSDTDVAQTAATSFTSSTVTGDKQVIFQIDPAACLDVANGFDCVTLVGSSAHASNILGVTYLAEMKYGGAAPPSLITD